MIVKLKKSLIQSHSCSQLLILDNDLACSKLLTANQIINKDVNIINFVPEMQFGAV